MRLRDHLSTGAALPRLSCSGSEEAVTRLARAVAEEAGVTDPDAFVREVLDREALDDTVLGLGAAVPHVRTPLVDDLHLGVATLAASQPRAAGDVDLLFLLAAPESAPRLMLLGLARLARLLKIPAFSDALRRARTPQALVAAFPSPEAVDPDL